MLPVVAGPRATKRQILAYTVALFPVALAPAWLGAASGGYALGAAALGALFIVCAVRVCGDATGRAARRMFSFSIVYLFALFTLLVVDAGVGRLA